MMFLSKKVYITTEILKELINKSKGFNPDVELNPHITRADVLTKQAIKYADTLIKNMKK